MYVSIKHLLKAASIAGSFNLFELDADDAEAVTATKPERALKKLVYAFVNMPANTYEKETEFFERPKKIMRHQCIQFRLILNKQNKYVSHVEQFSVYWM